MEVALYGFEDGALAIQPRAIAKTRIIDRTVVVLRDPDGAPVASDVEPPTIEASTSSRTSSSLGEGDRQSEYREWYKPILEMAFDDPDQEPPKLYWPNHVRVGLPWPNVWLSATNWVSRAKCGVWLVEGKPGGSLLPKLVAMQNGLLDQLPEGSFARVDNGTIEFGRVQDWATFASEDDKKVWITETLNAFVNVFRPVLKDLGKSDTAG